MAANKLHTFTSVDASERPTDADADADACKCCNDAYVIPTAVVYIRFHLLEYCKIV
jgi:hypothetical protein